MKERNRFSWLDYRVWALLLGAGVAPSLLAQSTPLPAGVQRLCSVSFTKDAKRPARLEDDALPCLELSVRRLKEHPELKLVLVGVKDETKDHEAEENGHMREEEDATGYDIRLEDLAAYRSLNTKGYLVHWYHVNPARILPTTDESLAGQEVTFYLVPGSADFNHNVLDTTKTNESPCTVKPCYPADEETLKAQPRERIRRRPAAAPASASK